MIASLVYLATQIRHSRDQMSQNTRALRAGSYQQGFDTLQEALMLASNGPALEEAVRLGLRDSDYLSEEEALGLARRLFRENGVEFYGLEKA